MTPLAFADSDKVKVGQRVIAVGNPFGFDETVTQGIISAKGRSMEDSVNDFFQTDAAINPGNSGGPLVDLRGEIIGINASIYAGNGGSGSWQGLGFAIPANTARRALEEIIKTGRVQHGYLGLMVPNQEQAARMGLPRIDGAYVYAVTPGSPAEHAGIRHGDVITAIAGRAVHNLNELRNQIAGLEAGSASRGRRPAGKRHREADRPRRRAARRSNRERPNPARIADPRRHASRRCRPERPGRRPRHRNPARSRRRPAAQCPWRHGFECR